MKEFLDDLTTRDQRMMFAVLTMVHTAESKEQLDNDTEALLTTARKHLCQFSVLNISRWMVLILLCRLVQERLMPSELLPQKALRFYSVQSSGYLHENGIYYGQNVISKI